MARNEPTQIPDNQSADMKKSKHTIPDKSLEKKKAKNRKNLTMATRSNKLQGQNQLQPKDDGGPPLPPSPSGQKNLTNVLTSVSSPPPLQTTATVISPDKDGNVPVSSSLLSATSTMSGSPPTDQDPASGGGTDSKVGADESDHGMGAGETDHSSSNLSDTIEFSDDDEEVDVAFIEEGSISKLTEEIKASKEGIHELQHLIGINEDDTADIPPEDVLTGGSLNVTKAELLILQKALVVKENMMTILTDIVDAQHKFDTLSGLDQESAKVNLLRLHQLLERSEQMMTTSPESTNQRPEDQQEDALMDGNNEPDPKLVRTQQQQQQHLQQHQEQHLQSQLQQPTQQQQQHPDVAKVPPGDSEMINSDDSVQVVDDANKKRMPNSLPPPTHQELLNNTNFNALSVLPKCPIEIIIPVWKYSNHCKRHPTVQAVPKQIWKTIIPYENVGVIETIPTSVKFVTTWSAFSSVPYSSVTPVETIIEFITAIRKKQTEWSRTPDARWMFTNYFCALSKTSPEVFGCDWKRAGELNPSPEASLWTAAVEALGCSFELDAPIQLTSKGILKSDMKGCKKGKKSLTFVAPSVPLKTKTGRFLTGRRTYQPHAKKISMEKRFTRKYQTYIQVTVPANICGIKRWDYFLEYLKKLIEILIEFEPKIVVIPFPGSKDAAKNRSRPFMYAPTPLSSCFIAKGYHQEGLYISEGVPTITKLFVGHDCEPVAFNSLELADLMEEKDGAIRVCHIQASKVIPAGYFMGSTKTINIEHWTENFNLLPRLSTLDVEIVILNIKDPTEDVEDKSFGKRKRNNKAFAAHVLCAPEDECQVDLALMNTYGKRRKLSHAAGDLLESRCMKYCPYNAKGLLTITAKEELALQKNRFLHVYNQDQYHLIFMPGLRDIFMVLTAPNGHKFTMCQVIMLTKCSFDLSTPLFIAVDVSPEGEVVVTCNKSMKTEAESLLAHFGIYTAQIFGSVVWQAFTTVYKLKMDKYQYCPHTCRAIEIDTSSIETSDSLDEDFTRCGFTDDVIEIQDDVRLDLSHQLTIHICPNINGILGDDNGDAATFNSGTSAATINTSKTAPPDPIMYRIPAPPSTQNPNETDTRTVTMSDPVNADETADADDTVDADDTADADKTADGDTPMIESSTVPQPPSGEAPSDRPEESRDG